MAHLSYQYDPIADVIEIEGIKYHGDLFRKLGFSPSGMPFRIVNREDGILTFQTLEPAGKDLWHSPKT